MTIEEVKKLVQSIECSQSDKQEVTNLLKDVACVMLDRIIAWNDPEKDWLDLELFRESANVDMQEKLKLVGLLSGGLKDAGEFDEGWHLDLKRLSIEVVRHKGHYWVPEWVATAIKWYRQNDGFADLKFKKYISQMRPVEEPDEKPWRPAPKNAPPHIRARGIQDEEDEPNYRRKVRDKAPRMKRGMGRI